MVSVMLLSGCAAYHESYQTDVLLERKVQRLDTADAFVVAVQSDGAYSDEVYDGSAELAGRAMVSALSRFANQVAFLGGNIDEDVAASDARKKGVDYLVYLRLLHWEERSTEWTGAPDRIEVEIRLIDARTGSVMESRIIKANSKFKTSGGDHPQDLLVKPFREFSGEIFGVHPDDSS